MRTSQGLEIAPLAHRVNALPCRRNAPFTGRPDLLLIIFDERPQVAGRFNEALTSPHPT